MLFATPVVAGDWEDGKAKFTRSVPINSMRALLTALTCLMLFATPVVAELSQSQLVESIGR